MAHHPSPEPASSVELPPKFLILTMAGVLAGFLAAPVLFSIPHPVGGDITQANLPIFASGHLLGTDLHGNDIGSRLLHGGRTSIAIALLVNSIGMVLGGFLGVASAYLGGIFETIAMRTIDGLLAIPTLVVVLAVSQAIKPSVVSIAMTLACISIPAYARVARTATIDLMKSPFMTVAKLSGGGFFYISARHVAPNLAYKLLTFALLGMGSVMTLEGALSFLGFGIPLPAPSWGGMIFQGQQVLSVYPMQTVLPSICLFFSILAFNILGERMRSLSER